MEKEIKPGVFIGVVTKQQWHDRMSILTGDDRQHFVEKCNLFREADDKSLVKSLGFKLVELLYVCKYLEPEFNVDDDYYTVRYAPNKEGA